MAKEKVQVVTPPARERFTVVPREGGSTTVGAEANVVEKTEVENAEATVSPAGKD